jgi:transposase-like protein
VSAHSVPLHCPYCAGESLHPHGDRHGAWECRECLRAFTISFVGLLAPTGRPGPTGGTEAVKGESS